MDSGGSCSTMQGRGGAADCSKKKGDVEVTHRRGEEGGVFGQNPW
jgi:hypothetical protein